MHPESHVGPIQLWRLNQALGPVHRVGRQPDDLVGRLEQVEPAVHGRLREGDVATEFGLVQELPHPQCRRAHQPPEVRQAADGCQRLQVALEVRPHVAVEPDRAVRIGPEIQRGRRVATAPGERSPVDRRLRGPAEEREPLGVGCREELLPPAAPPLPALLAARHRPEGEIRGTSRKRFRHLAHEKQVRGPGEQEAPGDAVAVDRPLHGEQQIGFALHLVEGHRSGTADQDLGVAACGIEHVEIIEGGVATGGAGQVLGKRALPGLPGAGHDDRRHDPQPVHQRSTHQPRQCTHGVDVNHSRRE